jgi:hypothetical protein
LGIKEEVAHLRFTDIESIGDAGILVWLKENFHLPNLLSQEPNLQAMKEMENLKNYSFIQCVAAQETISDKKKESLIMTC